jgi:ABC-type sugar transport system ATPase subunit
VIDGRRPLEYLQAIVGDNGAGKLTLIKCIAGVHAPTAGQILLGGNPVHFSSPEDARRAGIETVYQTLALVNDLTIWQNLFLNHERVNSWVDAAPMRPRGGTRFHDHGADKQVLQEELMSGEEQPS